MGTILVSNKNQEMKTVSPSPLQVPWQRARQRKSAEFFPIPCTLDGGDSTGDRLKSGVDDVGDRLATRVQIVTLASLLINGRLIKSCTHWLLQLPFVLLYCGLRYGEEI